MRRNISEEEEEEEKSECLPFLPLLLLLLLSHSLCMYRALLMVEHRICVCEE